MTEIRVIPSCLCSHVRWRHVLEERQCRQPGCGCLRYRPKEQR